MPLSRRAFPADESPGAATSAGARACRMLAVAGLGFALPVIMVVADKSAPAVLAAAALLANLTVILDGRRTHLARRYVSLLSRPALWAVVAVLILAVASLGWTVDAAITRRGLIEAVPELSFALAAAAAFPLIARRRDALWLVAGLLTAGMLTLGERRMGMPLHHLVGARAEASDLKRGSTPAVLLIWPALGYCLAHRRRLIALLLYAMAGAGVIAAHSAGPGVAMIVAGGTYLLARRAPHAAVNLGGLTLLALIVTAPWTGTLVSRWLPPAIETALRDEHATERIKIWNAFETRMHDRPLVGHGFNASFSVSASPRPDHKPLPSDTQEISDLHPHDIALQIWVELGLAGALTAAGLLLFVLRRLKTRDAEEMAPRLALLIAIVGIGLVGISAWQPWWLATIAAALVWFDLIELNRYPDGMPQAYGEIPESLDFCNTCDSAASAGDLS